MWTCRQRGVYLCTLTFTCRDLSATTHANIYICHSHVALNAFRLIQTCRPQFLCCVMLLCLHYTWEIWLFSICYGVMVLWLFSNHWCKVSLSGTRCKNGTVVCGWWVLDARKWKKKTQVCAIQENLLKQGTVLQNLVEWRGPRNYWKWKSGSPK